MTTTATGRLDLSDDDPDHRNGAERSATSTRADGPSSDVDRTVREILAPFVAWLATQGPDEAERRLHREAAERFLRWSHSDDGPPADRRLRYERHLVHDDPDHLAEARAGLDWWADHRRILACTLPTDR